MTAFCATGRLATAGFEWGTATQQAFCLCAEDFDEPQCLKAYIVNYADDLVICCRGKADEALTAMQNMMTKLKLTVNETKTRVCKLAEEKFDFLGYTFGRCYSPRTGRVYIGMTPSKKRVQRICQAISAATGRSQTQLVGFEVL